MTEVEFRGRRPGPHSQGVARSPRRGTSRDVAIPGSQGADAFYRWQREGEDQVVWYWGLVRQPDSAHRRPEYAPRNWPTAIFRFLENGRPAEFKNRLPLAVETFTLKRLRRNDQAVYASKVRSAARLKNDPVRPNLSGSD